MTNRVSVVRVLSGLVLGTVILVGCSASENSESSSQAIGPAATPPAASAAPAPFPIACPTGGVSITSAPHQSSAAAFSLPDGRGIACGQVDGTHSDFIKGHIAPAPTGGNARFGFNGNVQSTVTVNGTTTPLTGSIPFVANADYLFEIDHSTARRRTTGSSSSTRPEERARPGSTPWAGLAARAPGCSRRLGDAARAR